MAHRGAHGVEITADRALRNGGIQALPVESVLRLPAVFQDPARLTATMPGVVALNDGTNNMSVNGLAPFTMAWQIEGLEVSNPNHLANAGNIVDRPMPNGGGVNMLTQVLANSAFSMAICRHRMAMRRAACWICGCARAIPTTRNTQFGGLDRFGGHHGRPLVQALRRFLPGQFSVLHGGIIAKNGREFWRRSH